MEALSAGEIPEGGEWQYEPKWDGFRCVAFRDGEEVALQSKAGQPLARYFPELVEAVRALPLKRFVLDSEIAIPVGQKLSFENLQLRLHPAESRIRKLAKETPAIMIVFDLLVDDKGDSWLEKPLQERRTRLEEMAARHFNPASSIFLSPATTEVQLARQWFSNPGESLDGIIAKRVDLPYQSGERTGMQKIKQIRSVDCVVGGFRYGTKSKLMGSLLLGLYDEGGLLHHVGFCSAIKAAEKKKLTLELEALKGAPGFTGRAPGGPSRWATERSGEWEPLQSRLVVEVAYDHFTGGRFRHGTKFIRWRPDKAPRQCLLEQVDQSEGSALRLLKEAA
ncbi:MAG TPA: ATP-dependent DNA ligase [Verrucomicrobiae bacterium]|nr:ATP-dependent DNA ligase [Verrucomicrobiae bacterium]